jgi:hypothetical protein
MSEINPNPKKQHKIIKLMIAIFFMSLTVSAMVLLLIYFL